MTVAETVSDTAKTRTPGLAPWQERKVLHHLDVHLCRPIRMPELASLAGLSPGQFARRFKSSFGLTPREYLTRTRLDRAKAMMRQTQASLCEIALSSGFSDQSHMSRVFHAFVGDTPYRWRRENAASHRRSDPQPARLISSNP
jgi:AraC family transcriptional regulator